MSNDSLSFSDLKSRFRNVLRELSEATKRIEQLGKTIMEFEDKRERVMSNLVDGASIAGVSLPYGGCCNGREKEREPSRDSSLRNVRLERGIGNGEERDLSLRPERYPVRQVLRGSPKVEYEPGF